MFPSCRTEGEGFAIPTCALAPRDVEGVLEALWEFPSALHDCVARREPRAYVFDSMVGQCSKLARKAIEPIALQVAGGTIRGMQRFSSDVRWEEAQMRWHDHPLVADEMGDPEGVLLFDESGFVTKGTASVGVGRQDCGTLGKGEHGHVGVLAGYASRHGSALVDTRLCLPEGWCSNAQAARRITCTIPAELTWQSTPQVAAAMLQGMAQEGLLPCKDVVADWLYGHSPDLLDAVDACVGVTTCVAIPSETRCWLHRLRTEDKTSAQKGDVRAKRVVLAPHNAPGPGAALAASLPASRWYRRTVSDGTQGPMASPFARQRVTRWKEGLPDRPVWLVIQRTVGATPVDSYYMRNAPARTPWRIFGWLSGVRWAMEPCFEEGKTERGMDHQEVRTYPGWHHPMLTTMLAHCFLWHLKRRLKKTAPALTVSQRWTLLEVVLPLRTYPIEGGLALVAWVPQRNHQASRAHRVRRPEDGEDKSAGCLLFYKEFLQ